MVLTAFTNDTGFVASLDKACGKFINNNPVTRRANASSKSPELLAKYCDHLLKKSSKNPEEAELEDTLNQVVISKMPTLTFYSVCSCKIHFQMVVFKYIEDKDVFQKFYSKMLAKRLVQHMSASDDAEASMISKLKQACGFEYTSKLQRMFQDIGVSKDLNEQFRKHLTNSNEPLDIDFHIQVSDIVRIWQCCSGKRILTLAGSVKWVLALPAIVCVLTPVRAGEMRSPVHCILRWTAFRQKTELAVPHVEGRAHH